MDDDNKEFVPNVHFEQIPIKNLVSNQDYQRNISMQHVRKAAEHFDLYQINPVIVDAGHGFHPFKIIVQFHDKSPSFG